MPLKVRLETQCPFQVATGILGFLSVFKRSQASSPFEALNSTCLSSCQRDVRPSVEMRLGTRALSRVSTWDSDIQSCCEMIDEPAFKSLQGNQALPQVRGSWCPFHLRQQTLGPSHIPIAERSLLLRCEWKVSIPLEVKQGNWPSSQDDLGYTELFQVAAVNSVFLQTCEVFWGTLWSSIKDVKPPFVFDVKHGIAMGTMQGDWASSSFEGRNLWIYSSCGLTPGSS